MKQSEVTAAMTAWAVMIKNDSGTYPMFSVTFKDFDGKEVLARVEWHPPDEDNHVIHRGVTLYEPAVATVEGLDVSHFQRTIDWPEVSKTKVFTFIKATEGVSETDPLFATNWAASKAAGLLRSAYGFVHTGVAV